MTDYRKQYNWSISDGDYEGEYASCCEQRFSFKSSSIRLIKVIAIIAAITLVIKF